MVTVNTGMNGLREKLKRWDWIEYFLQLNENQKLLSESITFRLLVTF
jgi:hypothetical protein